MNNAQFSLNLFRDIQTILQYDFLRHAFLAGSIIAVVAGIVGYFIVIRRSAFAAHALSHIGFAGAAGAILFGLSPIAGLLSFTIIAGVIMATLSKRAASRDVEIGAVLAFMLGLGVLFISLYAGYATEAYSILFGQILGISVNDVWIIFIAGIIIISAITVIYRPLLFSSLDEDLAEAKGISIYSMGLIFMILVALATSISVQVVGVLLIFALMVMPAASAMRLSTRPKQGILISVFIALFATWLGIFLSFYLPYPVSFFITTIAFMIYAGVILLEKI